MHSRATGGELFRVIAIEPLPEEKAREVVYQIVDGVQHLHTLNIVHLDLKVRVWGAQGVRESANSDSLLRGRTEMPPQLGRLLCVCSMQSGIADSCPERLVFTQD